MKHDNVPAYKKAENVYTMVEEGSQWVGGGGGEYTDRGGSMEGRTRRDAKQDSRVAGIGRNLETYSTLAIKIDQNMTGWKEKYC